MVQCMVSVGNKSYSVLEGCVTDCSAIRCTGCDNPKRSGSWAGRMGQVQLLVNKSGTVERLEAQWRRCDWAHGTLLPAFEMPLNA